MGPGCWVNLSLHELKIQGVQGREVGVEFGVSSSVKFGSKPNHHISHSFLLHRSKLRTRENVILPKTEIRDKTKDKTQIFQIEHEKRAFQIRQENTDSSVKSIGVTGTPYQERKSQIPPHRLPT